MRIALVCRGHSPSSIKWAIGYLCDALNRIGEQASVVDLARGGTEKDCEGSDVVVVYRCVDSDTLEITRRLRSKGSFVTYFLDDYIFQDKCKYGGGPQNWAAPVPFMEEADALVSSSEKLLSLMPDRPKILRRTVLGPEDMLEAKREREREWGKPFSIGWTAGSGRKGWMDSVVFYILAELNAMMDAGERCLFHYFGDKRMPTCDKIKAVRHEYVPPEDRKAWIGELKSMSLDVVINPLEENDVWCWCKSELKFVESGAFGVPVVTSRVEPYLGLLKDGVDGFFASTSREFADRILTLMRNGEILRRMSERVRRRVEAEYDADNNARKFVTDVRNVMGKGRKT